MITEWRFKTIDDISRIICDDGDLYNLKGKRLNLKPNFAGYLRVRVYKDGKECYKWVHRLVAKYFIGEIDKKEVHHCDKNTRNNHYTNLEIKEPDEHRKYHKKQKEVECPF